MEGESPLLKDGGNAEKPLLTRFCVAKSQITDKGLRTLVLSPLSYFTRGKKSGIIEVKKEARRSADVYGKKRKAKQT